MLYLLRMTLLTVAVSFMACGSVPTDSTDGSGFSDDNTYVNEDWGFRVSAPDSTWGIQVQVFDRSPAPNGVPLLEMWFLAPSTSAGFRPVMYLAPDALATDKTLNELVLDVEAEISLLFENYASGAKQAITVGSEDAARWEFQATASDLNFIPGTQFWVTLVLHGREVYLMIGSGVSAYYPSDDYQTIVTNFSLID